MNNEKFAKVFLERHSFIDEKAIKEVQEILKDIKSNVIYCLTKRMGKIYSESLLNSKEKIIYKYTDSKFVEGKKTRDREIFKEPQISYNKNLLIIKKKYSTRLGIYIYKVIVYEPDLMSEAI